MAKYTVSCSWDDVPHHSSEQKAEYEAAYLPYNTLSEEELNKKISVLLQKIKTLKHMKLFAAGKDCG